MSATQTVQCEGCGGRGDLSIHGCDDSTCGICDGTGRMREPTLSEKRRWFFIESPEYSYTDVILDDGTGPTYDERDFLFIRTRTSKRAKVLALRAWRRFYAAKRSWKRPDYLYPGENPFRGMRSTRCDRLFAESGSGVQT